MLGLVCRRPHPPGSDRDVTRKNRKRKISGWLCGKWVREGGVECHIYKHSVKTGAQVASWRRLMASSDGELITSRVSFFNGETTRTAKEFALAAVEAVGFSKGSAPSDCMAVLG